MTETVLREIVRKAISDAAFRGQLRTDPGKALAGVGLTADERAAITSGDPARLTALGVDQRMSKVFSAGILSEVSRVIVSDETAGEAGAAADENPSGSTRAIIGDPASSLAAAIEVDSPAATHLRMIEQDLDTGASAETATSDASGGLTHLQRLEQDLDTGATTLESPSDTTSGVSHLQRLEQDLNTGSAFEAPADATTGPTHLQIVEGDLGIGAAPAVDVPSDVPLGDGGATAI